MYTDFLKLLINPSQFFYRNWLANSKTHMDMEEPQNNQNNLEKEQNWKTHVTISKLTIKLP
jgi:hypothetical protein